MGYIYSRWIDRGRERGKGKREKGKGKRKEKKRKKKERNIQILPHNLLPTPPLILLLPFPPQKPLQKPPHTPSFRKMTIKPITHPLISPNHTTPIQNPRYFPLISISSFSFTSTTTTLQPTPPHKNILLIYQTLQKHQFRLRDPIQRISIPPNGFADKSIREIDERVFGVEEESFEEVGVELGPGSETFQRRIRRRRGGMERTEWFGLRLLLG